MLIDKNDWNVHSSPAKISEKSTNDYSINKLDNIDGEEGEENDNALLLFDEH